MPRKKNFYNRIEKKILIENRNGGNHNGNHNNNGTNGNEYGVIKNNGNRIGNNHEDIIMKGPTPVNNEQKELIRSIINNQITFVSGCAGVGKTFVSVLYGMVELQKDTYKRIILTRPCVEANGERLGYLPGTSTDKLSVYMFPIFDILSERVPQSIINKYVEDKRIITLPLAFMRGVSFNNAYVFCDEAQNMSKEQMRLLLTRIGKNSKVVCVGDVKQSDIQGKNGLVDAIERFRGIDSIGIVELTSESIVRNPLIKIIEERYDL